MFFLVLGFFFDLKTKKIPNRFLLISFAVFLSFLFFKAYGLEFKMQKNLVLESLSGFFVAFFCTLPLYLLGALGAGDVKFFSVFGMLHRGELVLETFFYSLCWALVFGLFMVIFQGNLKIFLNNLRSLSFYQKPTKAHRIPFSFPFFMGFLSYSSLYGGLSF